MVNNKIIHHHFHKLNHRRHRNTSPSVSPTSQRPDQYHHNINYIRTIASPPSPAKTLTHRFPEKERECPVLVYLGEHGQGACPRSVGEQSTRLELRLETFSGVWLLGSP
ncbi:hypothetical protein PoB_001901200 [Plakobranchus ocellatus]|uniref:Uncharacterized protein n=1 Tax=Plakobranchus ocellatus TaxID=259542 RepID=A0AAV3ZB72_9GAST|nr:hypothetical protein PoB_001901200 [Plakobranchus ocellatus]